MPLSNADKIINLEDLAAFKTKIDESVLHKVGAETVTGEKIFSGIQTTVKGNESALMVVKDPVLVKGEVPESIHFLSLGFIDSTGNSYAQDAASRLGVFEYRSPSVSSPRSCVQMADIGFYEGAASAVIQVGHDENGIMFATAPATSSERTVSTDIVTRGYLEASEWNWQKTLKAESVTFVPVPESDLEPVVDFIFTETPPAEGEKGLDNPSTIAGVSSITVTHCQRRGVASTNYVIPLEDTYYGGSLDVATGVLTATHAAVAPEGAAVDISSAPAALPLEFVDTYGREITSADGMSLSVGSSGGTVVYKLAASTTVQLTPTQIKSLVAADKYVPRPNMVYSDQQAVQVGYQRFYDENRLAALEARVAALERS